MKVVILCGGLGTRLREQTEFIPKPLVPIGGKPILWHIMKIYYHQGFNEFVLPLGYKGELIKEYFMHYKWKSSDFTLEFGKTNEIIFHPNKECENWKIHFIDTGLLTKTAKRVYLVRKLLEEDESFMLTYGDGVADIDLKKLFEFHKQNKRMATITGFRPNNRFGLIEAENNIVKSFREKPRMTDMVNIGFMIFNKAALNYFTEEDVMLETDILPKMARDGQISVYEHKGEWYYMDTQRDWEELNKVWEQNPVWKIWKD
ncbi:MAG: sugar phosphate nucleotidyltransferase [Candidatus Woesearchaeota archaeon]